MDEDKAFRYLKNNRKILQNRNKWHWQLRFPLMAHQQQTPDLIPNSTLTNKYHSCSDLKNVDLTNPETVNNSNTKDFDFGFSVGWMEPNSFRNNHSDPIAPKGFHEKIGEGNTRESY